MMTGSRIDVEGPGKRPVRILHLEDDPRDAELIRATIETSGLECDLEVVDRRDRFEEALARGEFDVILCDYNLRGYDGISAVRLAREMLPATPVIVVSGTVSEDDAVKCLHAGAADYIFKERLGRLRPAIDRCMAEAARALELGEFQQKLEQTEGRLRQLAEQSSEGFWFVSLDPERMAYASPAMGRIWGVPQEQFEQDPQVQWAGIHPDDRGRIEEAWNAAIAGPGAMFQEEYRVVRPDGSVRHVLGSGTPVRVVDGRVVEMGGVVRDITENKLLQEQFAQAQKMESVGRLAGGVAHDFNNLLSVINGYTHMAMEALPVGDPIRADLREVCKAGDRAAQLTQQLLSFSRKQVVKPMVIDPAVHVKESENMLKRLIGENIQMKVAIGPGLGRINMDPGQLEQVVMNLAVNARDAMPDVGTLTIELRNAAPDEGRGEAFPPGPLGDHVMLIVSDTGTGMDKSILEHIFDPFFTTKERGKGTGLGLAMVYGIVKQNGGDIRVSSVPGAGSSFELYFPRVYEDLQPAQRPNPGTRAGGTETILVLEDEEWIRTLVERILRDAGYTVFTADGVEQALTIIKDGRHTVQLLLTDVIMPGMSGPDVARKLIEAQPGLRVVYMSGYTGDLITRHGELDSSTHFIAKPFTAEDLTHKVREVLDETG